jgi:CxxC motif-containing protein (DUF1111 family)
LAVALLASPAGATGPEAAKRELGRELFIRVWMPGDPRSHRGDGLGPVFNAQSCVACHDQGGAGGAGRLEQNIDIATVGPGGNYQAAYAFQMNFGGARLAYWFQSGPTRTRTRTSQRPPAPDPAVLASIHPGFRQSRSLVLHLFGTRPGYRPWRDLVPGEHGPVSVRVSQRNPTPLFGMGFIDEVPDAVLEAAARRRADGAQAVPAGRVSRLADGRIGRFGWKAQTATLEEFVHAAAATELGLEIPGRHQASDPELPGLGAPGLDMNQEECEALVAYVRSLPSPVARTPEEESEEVEAGKTSFHAIGCAGCHVPKLGDIDGIYSDLLLHDMGTRLADTGAYGVFGSSADRAAVAGAPRQRGRTGPASDAEWRTPPLWGLRDSAPYLHDGRAASVEQAISLHTGQGTSSARRYAQLPARRKQQLLAFLRSLTAPPEDERGAGN